jgi:hypothetical protein
MTRQALPFEQPAVEVGSIFAATIPNPAGITQAGLHLGAQVELPLSDAIVSSWQPAIVTQPIEPPLGNGIAYAVTTLQAPIVPGNYNLVWLTDDADGYFRQVVPLSVVTSLNAATYGGVTYPEPDKSLLTPTVAEIALLEQTRTPDLDTGQELGTFTSNTRPTSVQVEALIRQSVDDVLSEMRPVFDPVHYPQVKRICTFYTAMMIEGSFFREQTAEGTVLWQSEYREALERLNTRIEQDIVQNDLLQQMEDPHDGRWLDGRSLLY